MKPMTITEQYAERIMKLEKQVEEMQKALEWYADEDNTTDEMINDSGFRARQTLQSLKEGQAQ